jgi:uncharacterized cupin superfamily protein
MTPPSLIAVDAAVLEGPLEDWGPRAGADRGDPRTSGRVFQDAADGLPEVGVWECTPGSWTIERRADTETVQILSGRARMTDADGTVTELGPGDVLVLPRGWSGRWEILETVRKLYVIG